MDINSINILTAFLLIIFGYKFKEWIAVNVIVLRVCGIVDNKCLAIKRKSKFAISFLPNGFIDASHRTIQQTCLYEHRQDTIEGIRQRTVGTILACHSLCYQGGVHLLLHVEVLTHDI